MKYLISIIVLLLFQCRSPEEDKFKNDKTVELFNAFDTIPAPLDGQSPLFECVSSKVLNLGEVKRDTLLSNQFTFMNNGNYPLIIHDCLASCNCTDLELTKNYLLPGDSARVNVMTTTLNKFGHTRLSVTLVTNTEFKYHQFVVKCNVVE